MELTFSGAVWFWRGPSPFHFVTVPDAPSAELEAVSPVVSYGWGMIPVEAQVGDTTWTTALFPNDGLYVVPIKAAIRKAEGIEIDDVVSITLTVSLDQL